VSARFIGHRLGVKLSASTVFDRNQVVARYQRAIGKGVKVLDLDHYLEILLRKPGTLPGATALAQARGNGTFTLTHDWFWAAAGKALGDTAGARALIEVLLLHRHLVHVDVFAGITAALSVGSVSADVIGVQARKAAQRRGVHPAPIKGGIASAAGGQSHRASPRRPARLMTGRCPRSRSTTTCSGRPALESLDPAWGH
jgi:hypothetical protein